MCAGYDNQKAQTTGEAEEFCVSGGHPPHGPETSHPGSNPGWSNFAIVESLLCWYAIICVINDFTWMFESGDNVISKITRTKKVITSKADKMQLEELKNYCEPWILCFN